MPNQDSTERHQLVERHRDEVRRQLIGRLPPGDLSNLIALCFACSLDPDPTGRAMCLLNTWKGGRIEVKNEHVMQMLFQLAGIGLYDLAMGDDAVSEALGELADKNTTTPVPKR